MGYRDLYNHCQDLDIKVSRGLIKPKILEITGKQKIATAISGSLDPKVCRGLYLSINSDHAWARQNGSDVVVVSRQIVTTNYCWGRFITVKEMMHVFDTAEEACDTGEKFDALINAFCIGSGGGAQMDSENKCFWRALGVLCPERHRLQLREQLENQAITPYDVALKFRVPEQYIPHLFHPKFREWIELTF